MTKIAHLLQMPVGQGTGGYTLYVKTFKKRWKVSDTHWVQQCICTDGEEEILVEVDLDGNVSLSREFKARTGKIAELDWQNAKRKGLRVYTYTEPAQTADDYIAEADKVFAGEMKEVRGKCRYGVSIGFIKKLPNDQPANPTPTLKKIINEWVEFIINGT